MTKSQPSSKVKVAVRLRPFNKRETDLNTRCVVDMKDDQTFLTPPSALGKDNEKKQAKMFAFDHCFWSMDSSQKERFADQQFVFQCLGIELLDNAFAGYNACIFAYGQTGSGKSYTMMGSHDQLGLIPRLCNVLFEKIESETSPGLSFKVEVSYMEIYNEKVRDLLDPTGGRQQLKVREHKVLGPYVDGLQQLAASTADEVQELMSQGSKSRTVAATKMNAESSRSHAVFTLIVTHAVSDDRSGVSGERVSRLSLVDLAGSERSSKTGASGARLKEGSNINKSLTTLGLVISALADQAAGKAKNKFVPYRDSTLTWILKDNLGGNSRTTMVATLSPSADNYDETLSTLRYADRAKRIVNKAVVNEDPNARIIRELREEVEKLQMQLKQSESMRAPELKDKLEESEKLINEMSQTWEDKLRKTEQAHKKRQETLEKMGISLESSGIKLQKAKCFLVNLNADPSLHELLVYYLKDKSLVGQSDKSDIQLSGLGISPHHAELTVDNNEVGNVVSITPFEDARTCINGQPISSTCRLRHGDRILWGNNHFFRINIPRPMKKKEEKSEIGTQPSENADSKKELDTSFHENHPVSYEFAQQEVLLNQVDAPIQETIMNLEREFQLLQNENPDSHGEILKQSLNKLADEERKKYETEIDSLRKQLLSLTPNESPTSTKHNSTHESSDSTSEEAPEALPTQEVQLPLPAYQKYKNLKEQREKTFRTSISNLRENLVRAQALAREANAISTELKKEIEFTVTMRIPSRNLTPNRKKDTLLCEPAIQVVRQGKNSHMWSVEELSNRLIEMRELYEVQDGSVDHTNQSFTDDIKADPFNEGDQGQILIGVANIFLTCLIQDAPLYYPVPIINEHGQIAGKLFVGIQRIAGSIPEHMLCGDFISGSSDSESVEESSSVCSLSSDIDNLSRSSISSGMGSSLSPDPPAPDHPVSDSSAGATKLKDTSSSSMSSSSYVVTSSPKEKQKSKPKEPSLLTCRVTIIEAQSLPPTFSHFVECKYMFLDCPDVIVVPPDLKTDVESSHRRSSLHIHFNHSLEFTCNITEELVDRLTSHASLAIEVWGHRDRYHSNFSRTPSQLSNSSDVSSPSPATNDKSYANRKLRSGRGRGPSLLSEKSRTIKERWSEVMKRLQMELTIQELNERGEYESVDIISKNDVPSIGIFQLKQGQSRRIEINISSMPHSGTLPLICENITGVYAGSITTCSTGRDNKGLDSYQDRDLNSLRDKWSRVLDKQKMHLEKQMKLLTDKTDKTELQREREAKLFDQWAMLTEERNAIQAPTPYSGVPGAPASWDPPPTYEMHVPIVFLDLDSDVECDEILRPPSGVDSQLPAEDPGSFVQLPFVRPPNADYRGHVTAVVSWDPSMHDCVHLNRVTSSSERVYLIIKVYIRLSHPTEMDLVLRKRICVSVYKQKGFLTASLMRKMQGKPLTSSGVVYEVVSHVPPTTSQGEDQETLAMLAAHGANSPLDGTIESDDDDENDVIDNASHFEKYVMRATRSVDNILALDRIRQEVALRDALVHDPASSPKNRGADVVSIISKRNKDRPSSTYSTSTVNQRRSLQSPVADSKLKMLQQYIHEFTHRISSSPSNKDSRKSITTEDLKQERPPIPLQRSFSAIYRNRQSPVHQVQFGRINSPNDENFAPLLYHSTPIRNPIVIGRRRVSIQYALRDLYLSSC